MVLSYILLAVLAVSLISLIGVITLSVRQKKLENMMLVFVAFAAGTLLGVAFFDLLPESLEGATNANFSAVIFGILSFFVVERFIHWHHCHQGHQHKVKMKYHAFTYMNLFGDAIHNFLDGVVIAAAFVNNVGTGIITTIAIALHEIPQEIGDFAVLVHGGFGRMKALLFNFGSALVAFLGALVAYFFLTAVEMVLPSILAFAAGGFVYIAIADLFPELKKEEDVQKGFLQMVALIVGVIMVWWLGSVFPH